MDVITLKHMFSWNTIELYVICILIMAKRT
uniref:Uncharacterized protein n=1 Tax=Podoviridae sp. ctG4L18 TaxID=2825234 RepID=A0A8S5UPI2_9CAUD|nr:MAG TPA: hypothetical protein [Podoviridae sp. ctG4L18]